MKKILLILTLLSTIVFAKYIGVTVPLDTANDTKSSTTKDYIDVKGAIISMPKIVGSTMLELPQTKKNFKPQIQSLNSNTGTITFKVYDEVNERFLDGSTSYNNDKFEQKVQPKTNDIHKIDKIVKDRANQLGDNSNRAVAKYYKDLKEYKKQLSSLDTSSTHTNSSYFKEFLTLSKFAVACLTLDNNVIDIEKSMLMKKIVLQARYTMNLKEAMPYTQGSQSTTLIDSKLQQYVKKFSIKTFFFILEWQQENNQLIQEIKMFLMGIFLPLTVGYMGMTGATKKVQKITSYEDYAEKGVMLIGVFILFFMPSTVFKGQGNEQLQQTVFQKWAVDTVRGGVDFADKLTLNTVTSYSQWQMNNLGVMSNEQLTNVYTAQTKTKLTQKLYTKLYQQECLDKYEFTRLAEFQSYMKNSDTLFFTDEEYATSMANWEKQNAKLDYGKPYPFGNREFLTKGGTLPKMSLSACSQVEKDLRILNNDMKEYEKFELKLDNMKNGDITKDVQLLTKLTKDGMTYAKHLGFIYAPYILLQDYFVRNITDENSPLSDVKRTKKFSGVEDDKFKNEVLEYMKTSIFPNEIASGYMMDYIGEMGVDILKILPYKMLPSFSPIQESIYNPIHNAFVVATDMFTGKATAVIDVGAYIGTSLLAYNMTKTIMEFAPAFLMIVAGLWVVVFYLISLFIYFFVSPFILAYALGSQQTEVIRSFIARGVVMSLKPIMLVLSIVITLVALDLTMELLSFTEDVILQNMITINDVSGFKFIMFTFFQGLFHVIALVVTSIMAFTLVFKGADMILALFGFKESGTNVKEVVGGDIENKAGKYQSTT